jgi:hypothetical protein
MLIFEKITCLDEWKVLSVEVLRLSTVMLNPLSKKASTPIMEMLAPLPQQKF